MTLQKICEACEKDGDRVWFLGVTRLMMVTKINMAMKRRFFKTLSQKDVFLHGEIALISKEKKEIQNPVEVMRLQAILSTVSKTKAKCSYQ